MNFYQVFFPFGGKCIVNDLLRYGIRENSFYRRDHLGSIREVVKSAGGTNTLVARYDYDPYGKRLTQYQSSAYTGGCDFGYTGHITVPSLVAGQTELVLTHYRGYDPHLARWLSADPIGEAGGMNLYGYCYGNPLNLYDPDGMMPSAAWWGGFLDFDQGTLDALGVGAMATADGFIPFSDPFQLSGGYSGCQDGVGFSKGAGEFSRDAAIMAIGAGLGARATGVKGAGREFSHWIPNRFLNKTGNKWIIQTFGRSIWNGNYVTPARHFMQDPYRYIKGWQELRRLPPILQQLDRIPNILKGLAAGGAAAAGAHSSEGGGCP